MHNRNGLSPKRPHNNDSFFKIRFFIFSSLFLFLLIFFATINASLQRSNISNKESLKSLANRFMNNSLTEEIALKQKEHLQHDAKLFYAQQLIPLLQSEFEVESFIAENIEATTDQHFILKASIPGILVFEPGTDKLNTQYVDLLKQLTSILTSPITAIEMNLEITLEVANFLEAEESHYKLATARLATILHAMQAQIITKSQVVTSIVDGDNAQLTFLFTLGD